MSYYTVCSWKAGLSEEPLFSTRGLPYTRYKASAKRIIVIWWKRTVSKPRLYLNRTCILASMMRRSICSCVEIENMRPSHENSQGRHLTCWSIIEHGCNFRGKNCGTSSILIILISQANSITLTLSIDFLFLEYNENSHSLEQKLHLETQTREV